MKLEDLEVYKLACELSKESWEVYSHMSTQDRIVIGSQFIRAIDSVGANIAEGFGRFHYLDKNKFNYNARGSLFESIHWVDLLEARGFINNKELGDLKSKLKTLSIKLNNYISSTRSRV